MWDSVVCLWRWFLMSLKTDYFVPICRIAAVNILFKFKYLFESTMWITWSKSSICIVIYCIGSLWIFVLDRNQPRTSCSVIIGVNILSKLMILILVYLVYMNWWLLKWFQNLLCISPNYIPLMVFYPLL